MAHHTPYDDFRIDCVQDVFRIVRGGTVREELPLLLKCVHSQLGAGIKLTVGEPPDHVRASAQKATEQIEAASTEDLQKCCEALQQAESEIQNVGAGEGDEAEKMDPATIIALIQVVVSLIQKAIERRKNRPQPT